MNVGTVKNPDQATMRRAGLALAWIHPAPVTALIELAMDGLSNVLVDVDASAQAVSALEWIAENDPDMLVRFSAQVALDSIR